MDSVALWKAWLNCSNEAKATRALEALLKPLPGRVPNVELRPYHEGGFVAEWRTRHASAWNDTIVEVLANAQLLGTGWTLTGDIHKDPEGLLSRAAGHQISATSVTLVQWSLRKEVATTDKGAV